MRPQVHILGKGLIGEAAQDEKHRWVILDDSSRELQDQDTKLEDNSEFSRQFSGVKTVVVIPVDSRGVLHFGSTKEIFEDTTFVHQARECIRVKYSNDGSVSSQDTFSSVLDDLVDENELFAPMLTCQNIFYSDPSPIYDNLEDNPDSSIDPLSMSIPCADGMLYEGGFTLFSEQEDSTVMLAANSSDSSKPLIDGFETFPDFDDLGSCTEFVDDLGLESDNPLILEPGDLCEDRSSCLGIYDNLQTTDHCASSLDSFQVDASQWLNSALEEYINGLDKTIVDNLQNEQEVATCSSDQTGNDVLDANNYLAYDKDVSNSKIEAEGSSELGNWDLTISEFNLEQLLDVQPSSVCVMDASIQDQSPSDRSIRLETFPTSKNQIPTASDAWMENSMRPLETVQRTNDYGFIRDWKPEPKLASRITDTYVTFSSKSCLKSSLPKRTQERGKPKKKTAKRGKGNKPRPKDRQLIQDRISELREILPEATKCSQVELLGKALKHLVFLQSMIDYVEKLTSVHDIKKTEQPNPNSSNNNAGITWAVDVEDQHTYCPILVQDTGLPSLMHIEMFCEDHGILLEIADLIKKLGLTVLKGVMEVQMDKVHANFMVEVNGTLLTRKDVSIALIRLMQNSTTSESNKLITNATSLWSNYREPLQASLPC